LKQFWVYVIQGRERITEAKTRPGFFYVGMSVNPAHRLRQHNGEIVGGARSTRAWRPWRARALYGPYDSKSEALRAERALKRKKRGEGRTRWLVEDSPLCRGEGAEHPWVRDSSWRPEGI
jgi:predicted GIY-YIG superfamily endonuclease